MDELLAAGAAGAGFAGGFWSWLCAKTGVNGAPANRLAKVRASRDRNPCEAALATFALKMDRFKVPHTVLIIIFIPQDSVPAGRVYFDLTL